MQVSVDQVGREEAVLGVVRRERVATLAARMHAGNKRADHADIGWPHLAGHDVDHRAADEKKIERGEPAGGAHGAVAEHGVVEVVGHG